MDSDREQHDGRVPLPGFGAAAPGEGPAPNRRDGIRHARRMSNWTLAALIAGTGAATVALAHHAVPATAGTATTAAGATAVTGTTASPAAHGASGPQVTHSVATTSGSGVTVTTTTHAVKGKTIITRVRHVPVYHDN